MPLVTVVFALCQLLTLTQVVPSCGVFSCSFFSVVLCLLTVLALVN